MSVEEENAKFKELVKQGYSVRRAWRGSGLHPRDYKKHYGEIWGDPNSASKAVGLSARLSPGS
jgi:hypothetical protein